MRRARKIHRIFVLMLFGSLLQAEPELTTLTNPEGREIKASILEIETDRVQIQIEGKHQAIWLNRTLLSERSNQEMDAMVEAKETVYRRINDGLGIPLFNDMLLWDDAVSEVAARLQWPRESNTELQSSFRLYPRSTYEIINAHAYSAALYGESGHPAQISIVFANKGDYPFSTPPEEDEIEAMEASIEADSARVQSTLTELFGQPTREKIGNSRGLKQFVDRWDWQKHSFLLATEESEYVNLQILKTDLVENQTRSITDADLREYAKKNLLHRPNGDVIIANIPMVNQGPKGYCVPATFERYLRYLQIPADMYLLAMTGQTGINGGTSLTNMMQVVEGYASSHNRRLVEINKEVDIRAVRKYIDDGLPLIWTMFSTNQYNQLASQNTAQREQVTDWDAWVEYIRQQSREIELSRDFNSGHACLIIGYNFKTDEIAVSDSWGPSFEIRWVPAEHVEQVSQESFYLIAF